METVSYKESKEDIPGKFRELFPERQWSAQVELNGLNWEQFQAVLKEAARKMKFTYSGFREAANVFDQEKRMWVPGYDEMYYYFSRYPRRAFGPVSTIEQHIEAMKQIEKVSREKYPELPSYPSGAEEAKMISDTSAPLSFYPSGRGRGPLLPSCRVILGLNEGYEKEKPIVHTTEEVAQKLGKDFDVKGGGIFTIGPWGEYTEPATIITGNPDNLDKVYKLAEDFKQERIAVENLSTRLSWMVETQWCKKPDPQETITIDQITSMIPYANSVPKENDPKLKREKALSYFRTQKPLIFNTSDGKVVFTPKLYMRTFDEYVHQPKFFSSGGAYIPRSEFYYIQYVITDIPQKIANSNTELAETLKNPHLDKGVESVADYVPDDTQKR